MSKNEFILNLLLLGFTQRKTELKNAYTFKYKNINITLFEDVVYGSYFSTKPEVYYDAFNAMEYERFLEYFSNIPEDRLFDK
jgi:hypothetical protein